MSDTSRRRYRHRRAPLALLVAALASCGDSAVSPPDDRAVACDIAVSRCAARVGIAGGAFLPVFNSFPLTVPNAHVTQAVIVVHGADRDADAYFTTMITSVRGTGRLEETIVVAPHFQKAEDGPRPDEPYWTEEGWKRGHLSVVEGPQPRVSSYTALDRIVALLADRTRFPNISRIVVAGHSAGGQVVHRYAAGSRAEDTAPAITFRYVVANPSTYLYPGPERPAGDGFAVPDIDACPAWDNWHLGLQNLNTYMNAVPLADVRTNLTRRDVRILIGDRDTGSAQLDQSCGANLQGAHRFERGRLIVRYMDAQFAGHAHVEMIVPDVAHSSRQMFTSAVGRTALFGLQE